MTVENIGAPKKTMSAREIDAWIGARLREVRKERRMTLEQMSGHLGIGLQQLHKYETGVNSIRVNLLLDFAAQLGISFLYFIADCDDEAYSDYQLVRPWRAMGKRAKARVMAFVTGGAA